MMGLTKATKSKVLISAGLAQLLAAASALGYFAYLRTPVSPEAESLVSLVNRAGVSEQASPSPSPRESASRAASIQSNSVFTDRGADDERADIQFAHAAYSYLPRQTQDPCFHVRIAGKQESYQQGQQVTLIFQIISSPPAAKLTVQSWNITTGRKVSENGSEVLVDTSTAQGEIQGSVNYRTDPQGVCVKLDENRPVRPVTKPPPQTPPLSKNQDFQGSVDFGNSPPANKAGIAVQVTCGLANVAPVHTDANGRFSFSTTLRGECNLTFSQTTDSVKIAGSHSRELKDGQSQLGLFFVRVTSQATPTPTISPTPTPTISPTPTPTISPTPTPTISPTPTPTISPTPTPTPTISPSPTETSSLIPGVGNGEFSVTWPRALARGEEGEVIVSYTPPAGGGMPDFAGKYRSIEVELTPRVDGLILLESNHRGYKTLGSEPLSWVYRIKVEDGAGSIATCEITVVPKVTLLQGMAAPGLPQNEVISLTAAQDRPATRTLQPVLLKQAEIDVLTVPPKTWLATSGIFGPFGAVTLGLGIFPPKPRYVNVSLVGPVKETLPRNMALSKIESYYVRINVGPLSPETIVQNLREFPARLLPSSDTGHWLEAVVASDDLILKRHRYRFFLPNNGPSWVCECCPGDRHTCDKSTRKKHLYVAIEPKWITSEAKLRIGIYYEKNLIQSQLITVEVAEFEREGKEQVSVIDYSLAANLDSLASFSPRTLNILANDSGNGTHTIVINGALDDAVTFNLSEGQVDNAIGAMRQALLDLHVEKYGGGWLSEVQLENRYDANNAKSKADFIADLKKLAPLGTLLWERLFTKQLSQWQTLETKLLKTPGTIQVSRVHEGSFVFPWGAVYDIPLESDSSLHRTCRLLDEWEQAEDLIDAERPACPYEETHEMNTICPFGFWGFKHIIEQPPCMPEGRQLPRVIKVAKRPIDLVVALSLDLDKDLAKSHFETLETKLADTMKVIQHRSRQDIQKALANPRVEVVYFYCHGGRGPLPGSDTPIPFLGIGNKEMLTTGDLLAWKRSWKGRHWEDTSPLVFINGCHTAEITPDMLVNFVDAFVGIYAAGVIGTEIVLDQRIAGEAAQIFFEAFKHDRCSVGVALHKVRRTLLLKGNLLGLVYTPYCSADLHLA